MLEEFYKHMSMVGVSSMTGDGIDEFFAAVEEKKKEFDRDYKPELEKRRKERQDESAPAETTRINEVHEGHADGSERQI